MTAPARKPAMPEPQGRFKPYPKYKDSGVEWLGDVPEEWHVWPLKRGYDVTLGKMLESKSKAEENILLPYLRAANIQWDNVDIQDIKEMYFAPTEIDQLKLLSGDLLVSEGGDVGRSALWHGELEQCGFQNSVNRVRDKAGNDTRFLYYWMFFIKHAGWIDIICNKSTIAHFTAEKVQAVPVAFPPAPEQRAIAAFLDRETAKVDALIEQQQRLIELLKEKRQAVISHAITKGLNPDAPMKDSGIPWLGMVPEHWEIVRNKALFMEIDDRAETDEGKLLSVSHITGVTPRSEKNVNMFLAETLEGYKRCQKGDLIINTMWAWMGALGISPCQGVVSPSYNVYRLKNINELYPQYYDYLCRTPQHVGMIKANSTGVWESRLRLYPQIFLSQYTCVPSYLEQIQIVQYLDTHLEKIATILADCQRAIDLLQEHRAALITAAVTGKIDVRNAA